LRIIGQERPLGWRAVESHLILLTSPHALNESRHSVELSLSAWNLQRAVKVRTDLFSNRDASRSPPMVVAVGQRTSLTFGDRRRTGPSFYCATVRSESGK
jgi:hypothetical protein